MKPVASLVSVVLSVGLVALGVACTERITRIVPPVEDAGSDGGRTPAGDDDDVTGDDDDVSGDDDDVAPPKKDAGPPDCKKERLYQNCIQCCEDQEPAGSKVYTDAVKECTCTDEKCKPTCGTTFCVDKQVDNQACVNCLNAEGASDECQTIVSDACLPSESCKRFNTCGAGCQGKPQR